MLLFLHFVYAVAVLFYFLPKIDFRLPFIWGPGAAALGALLFFLYRENLAKAILPASVIALLACGLMWASVEKLESIYLYPVRASSYAMALFLALAALEVVTVGFIIKNFFAAAKMWITRILAALHAAALIPIVCILFSKDYLVFLFIWPFGLGALGIITFTLGKPGSKAVVVAAAIVSLFIFGPATFLLEAAVSGGLREGRSLLTPWFLALAVFLIALEAGTIVLAGKNAVNIK